VVPVEVKVMGLLQARGWSLVTAESCTGGLIGHRLTNVPGISAWYWGGFVTYGDSAKRSVLGVEQSLLERHGAVSAEVVGAMAAGARRVSGAALAVAVSGIAGPGGGTPGKPVGLVFIGLDGPRGTRVARHLFRGERPVVKDRAADAALAMVEEELRAGT
jgi:PncC family amidohydrolase